MNTPSSTRILFLNGPCTRNFARTGRWQATSRGASLWYPIWLAGAAALLDREGFDVLLLDAPAEGLDLEAVIARTRTFAPHLCVIDTSTASITHDLQTAQRLKQVFPAALFTCLVGPHASALPETLISCPEIDFIAAGEYDETILDLARALQTDSGFDIPGLWRKENGQPKRGSERPLIHDLDALPFASSMLFKHLDIRRYRLDFALFPYMNIMTSRGCPAHCTFCLWPQTLTRGKFRERSLDHVFAEIAFVRRQNPRIREFFFDDDTFTVRPERIRAFCERYLREVPGIPFSVNARADLLDESLLLLMKQAGLRCFVVGFESGNQEILDRIRKGTRLDTMRAFAALCDRLGIQIHGDFVLGLPGETPETIAQTLRFARSVPLSTFQISIAHPLPGTDFFRWLDSKGYLLTHDFSRWIDAQGAQRCVFGYPDLPAQEIEAAVRKAILSYYLSLSFAWQALFNIARRAGELRRYLRGGMRLLSALTGR